MAEKRKQKQDRRRKPSVRKAAGKEAAAAEGGEDAPCALTVQAHADHTTLGPAFLPKHSVSQSENPRKALQTVPAPEAVISKLQSPVTCPFLDKGRCHLVTSYGDCSFVFFFLYCAFVRLLSKLWEHRIPTLVSLAV